MPHEPDARRYTTFPDGSRVNHVLDEQVVGPFYMALVGGGLKPGFSSSVSEFRSAIQAVTDADVGDLLDQCDWRNRLVAGWIIGLTRRTSFVERIGTLLIEHEVGLAGQGYCVALGLIGDESCRRHLRAYLATYLPARGRDYDQLWAFGALTYVEGQAPHDLLDSLLWEDMDPLAGIRVFRVTAEAAKASE
jgi:hypothetical protein